MSESDSQNRRKHIRFKADPNTLVWIDFEMLPGEFNPAHVGLVFEESKGGCGALILNRVGLKIEQGQTCMAKVGELPPKLTVVNWVRDLDNARFVTFGLKFT